MPSLSNKAPHLRAPLLATIAAGVLTLAAAGPVQAADKFKVTSAECEMFWLFRHTPVVNYDIVDERVADYRANPDAEYFRQAAQRTAEYCDRTSGKPQAPLGPPRKIRGVWFQSNDGKFKALFDLDSDAIDFSAGVINRIADQFAADQRAATQKAAAEQRHEAQLEEVRTREARAREVKEAEEKVKRERSAAESARQKAFFDSRDLQVARLGTAVQMANFTFVTDVRTNPFHFKKLGFAVVRTQFNRMMSEKVAMFGNELAPIFVHLEDVDRFTKSGETVMLAFKVVERVDVERSYGSIPEIILSSLKSEPLFGEYVGAYSCPGDDCQHIFDAQSRS